MNKTVTPWIIYHNPRCSKSRAALQLLQERGIEARVIEYLKTPPSRDELRAIVNKLGIKAEALLRKSEDLYKQEFAGKAMSEEQCIAALADHPALIERPIVVHGDRAALGRPPEKIAELF